MAYASCIRVFSLTSQSHLIRRVTVLGKRLGAVRMLARWFLPNPKNYSTLRKMKVKLVTSMSENSLEKKVNGFMANPAIEVVQLQFQAHLFGFAVLISYKEKSNP